MFLKNCWYVACWDHELIDGKLLARTLLEEPVLLYKAETGRVVALKDRCCHRGAPLSLGRREGECVRCMYHGLKFDPSGKCIQIPGQEKSRNVDRRNIGRMLVPGVFFLESMFSPAGSGSERGNREGTREYRNCQFMTPETRRTTHFFFVYLNNFEGSDTTISRSLRD